jgi:hypothetical protein
MNLAQEILSIPTQPRKKPAPDRTRKQLDKLDAYFRAGGSLTVTEAITAFGCYALSQRVGQLRRELGKPVVSTWEETPTGAKVKRYRYAIQLDLLPREITA